MSNTEVIKDKCRIIRPIGEIDYSNAGEFEAAVTAAVTEEPRGFVIDLSQVTYFDSTGMRVIVYALSRLHESGGRLGLVVGNEYIEVRLANMRLERFPRLLIRDSVESAEQALTDEPQV